jgi:hypothetical protein
VPIGFEHLQELLLDACQPALVAAERAAPDHGAPLPRIVPLQVALACRAGGRAHRPAPYGRTACGRAPALLDPGITVVIHAPPPSRRKLPTRGSKNHHTSRSKSPLRRRSPHPNRPGRVALPLQDQRPCRSVSPDVMITEVRAWDRSTHHLGPAETAQDLRHGPWIDVAPRTNAWRPGRNRRGLQWRSDLRRRPLGALALPQPKFVEGRWHRRCVVTSDRSPVPTYIPDELQHATREKHVAGSTQDRTPHVRPHLPKCLAPDHSGLRSPRSGRSGSWRQSSVSWPPPGWWAWSCC